MDKELRDEGEIRKRETKKKMLTEISRNKGWGRKSGMRDGKIRAEVV